MATLTSHNKPSSPSYSANICTWSMCARSSAHAVHSPSVTEHFCSIKSKSLLSESAKLVEMSSKWWFWCTFCWIQAFQVELNFFYSFYYLYHSYSHTHLTIQKNHSFQLLSHHPNLQYLFSVITACSILDNDELDNGEYKLSWHNCLWWKIVWLYFIVKMAFATFCFSPLPNLILLTP